MRAVVQRVTEARVNVAGKIVGEIGRGLMVLIGVSTHDTEVDAAWLADKLASLRIFEDDDGKMNLACAEIGGAFWLSLNSRFWAMLVRVGVPVLL